MAKRPAKATKKRRDYGRDLLGSVFVAAFMAGMEELNDEILDGDLPAAASKELRDVSRWARKLTKKDRARLDFVCRVVLHTGLESLLMDVDGGSDSWAEGCETSLDMTLTLKSKNGKTEQIPLNLASEEFELHELLHGWEEVNDIRIPLLDEECLEKGVSDELKAQINEGVKRLQGKK